MLGRTGLYDMAPQGKNFPLYKGNVGFFWNLIGDKMEICFNKCT